MPTDPEVLKQRYEQGNNPELPQYKKIELGDAQTVHMASPQQSQSQAQQIQQPVQKPQPDPTAFWPQMSNTGYKPSLRLIQNVTNLLSNGNNEWADTWFSILFQKIVKKVKLQQTENSK